MAQERNAEQTRQSILEAATREFVAKGLAGARIDEIAAQSGYNKGMIYQYFGKKEELYSEVLRSVVSQELQAIPDIEGLEPVEAVRRIAGAYFDHCVSHPDYVSLMLWEAVAGWSTLNRVWPVEATILSSSVQLARRGIEAGVFRAGADPVVGVNAAIGQYLMYTALAARLQPAWPAARDQVAVREQLIELVLYGLVKR